MFQKARETAYLESTSVFVLLLRWWKPLLVLTLVAALSALIFSGPYFITPKYRSSVVFFPAATNSISRAVLEQGNSANQDILAFGAEEQAEQLLQILNSDEIREIIIRKYDLINHYRIDLTKEFPQTRLHEEYSDNITFSRTEFLSVRIDVLDQDPIVAASIANDILSLLDTMKTKIQRTRITSALQVVENAYSEKQAAIKLKEDSLTQLRRNGVMDYKNQSMIWSEEYAKAYSTYNNEKASLSILKDYHDDKDSAIVNTKARIEGAGSRMKHLQVELNRLASFGGASVSLNEELSLERKELSLLKEQLNKLKIDASQNVAHTFVVNKAEQSEKKAYPNRWLIVLVTTLAAFLMGLSVILIKERIKELQY
ncbi:MAG TPA: hypothetical protein PKM97_03525 [Bacteroidia bacterium]|nr:hypothetical protein [Bacteroidia bacterium]